MMREPRVAIVGAGPGGLTLARILQIRGIAATVFEREDHESARSQGGTLDMHVDGGQFALRLAGLEAEFAAVARPEDQGMRLFDSAGRLLYNEPDEVVYQDRPEVDRGALRSLLLDSLPPGIVRWANRVDEIDLRADGTARLTVAGGQPEEFDLVVGADGARSRVRPLVSTAQPAYCGVTFVELTIADVDSKYPGVAQLVGRGKMFALGGNKALIAQRNARSRIFTYVGLTVPESWASTVGVDWADGPTARALLRRHFDGWDQSLLNLIDQAGDRVRPWPLYALPVGHRWPTRAGVTLIGDSAHLMSPFGGRGANLAMRDAADLAVALSESDLADWPDAVAACESALCDRSEDDARGAAEGLAETFADDGLQHSLEWMRSQLDAA